MKLHFFRDSVFNTVLRSPFRFSRRPPHDLIPPSFAAQYGSYVVAPHTIQYPLPRTPPPKRPVVPPPPGLEDCDTPSDREEVATVSPEDTPPRPTTPPSPPSVSLSAQEDQHSEDQLYNPNCATTTSSPDIIASTSSPKLSATDFHMVATHVRAWQDAIEQYCDLGVAGFVSRDGRPIVELVAGSAGEAAGGRLEGRCVCVCRLKDFRRFAGDHMQGAGKRVLCRRGSWELSLLFFTVVRVFHGIML